MFFCFCASVVVTGSLGGGSGVAVLRPAGYIQPLLLAFQTGILEPHGALPSGLIARSRGGSLWEGSGPVGKAETAIPVERWTLWQPGSIEAATGSFGCSPLFRYLSPLVLRRWPRPDVLR